MSTPGRSVNKRALGDGEAAQTVATEEPPGTGPDTAWEETVSDRWEGKLQSVEKCRIVVCSCLFIIFCAMSLLYF